ncbi:helix-turn-helix transcriptional regulator [Geobacter sulfurreducens]|uniref:helix-turn-helix domain-containing protein n=1 Tax=Geobacter sulfurreducens TaxID=35554 RepID=UPI001BDD7719|nr:helix-turn-helix transcriptional regulator [Geobacter sulfurreducens]QVW35342.1 helix-turn-helix transcriptional regulator [Geobacter sulfurreducens]
MADFYTELGARIRSKREALGLNQRELAAKLGVQPPAITMYEHGKRSPSLELFFKLAQEIGSTTDYLLGATEQQDVIIDDETAEAFRQYASLSPRDRRVVVEVIRALAHVPE